MLKDKGSRSLEWSQGRRILVVVKDKVDLREKWRRGPFILDFEPGMGKIKFAMMGGGLRLRDTKVVVGTALATILCTGESYWSDDTWEGPGFVSGA